MTAPSVNMRTERAFQRSLLRHPAIGKFTQRPFRSLTRNLISRTMPPMPAGLPVAFLLSAQAVTAPSQGYGPAVTNASAPAAAPVKEATRECSPSVPDPNSREIVVCAVKPNGYRLDPDILAAKRAKKKGESIRPRNPRETFVNHDCATIGPMGCRGQVTVDAFTAAAVLAQMAAKLSNGQPIGPMFRTQPTETEYQLYLEAKKQREANELDKAAKAKAAAAQAALSAQQQPKAGAPAAPAR